MLIFKKLFAIMILIFAAGCQPTLVSPSPSPTQQPIDPPTPRPTQTPHRIILPTATSSPTALPSATFLPTLAPPFTLTPTVSAPLPPASNAFQVGTSVLGRAIWGWRFGSGQHILLIVGGIHTGFEANTVLLVNQLIEHFETVPADVLPGMTLLVIPVLNPDGLELGRVIEGRFNANQVDLNRNWGCEWSSEAYFQDRQVNPGVRPFSEPETKALASLIRNQPPAAAIFYHSAANAVFAGECEGGHGSDQLATVIGEAAGYAYGEPFTAYPVSGTEASWVDGQGIPAVDVELSTTHDSEFTQNLRAIIAVQHWLLRE